MINILYCVFFILFLEIFLIFIVHHNKKNFQWLITENEEYPDFKKENVNNFFKSSYNKSFGWLKRPNITDYHDKLKKKTKFSIDTSGARKSKFTHLKKKIEAYGDSFVFGRYVKDDQVWTEILSKKMNSHIINYGVGNFGFDQALLRYEKNKHRNSIFTIIGVVPETINRIHSTWKNYLEFGNIYGFKPSFFLNGEKLKLRKNPISKKKDFHKNKIIKIIETVSKNDIFYKKKFKKFQFRKPYLLSFFRNFNFNCKLFINFFLFLFSKHKDKKKYLFPLYYSNNIESANRLYTDKKSIKLFSLLIKRFKNISRKKNSVPIIIIFPQRRDIELYRKKKNYYCSFFNSIKDIKIIDLTNFLSKKNIKKIYLDEEHGGHLTAYGNRVVTKKIQEELNYA
ncbi:hypothetical protein IDH06_01955 [Pelagibacterales bacterium SAG-MED25]|uniref:hypothetical protein n=1 Tax=Pelagibacter sp. (strain HTCC7211) TaxID=439493 RepID=UPI000303E0B7|nr:hypothetical protein [Candidatus Pelagibacter sp. HTCC7211]MBD1151151.1 hypothetical protein [Pelagibacterales bacterium SAG-MED25]